LVASHANSLASASLLQRLLIASIATRCIPLISLQISPLAIAFLIALRAIAIGFFIFRFLVCGYRCRDVITIHTLIDYGKNSTHTFWKLFGKSFGASERGTKSCIEVRLEPFPDGKSTGADSMMTIVLRTINHAIYRTARALQKLGLHFWY
jgi:hypothetical protein